MPKNKVTKNEYICVICVVFYYQKLKKPRNDANFAESYVERWRDNKNNKKKQQQS